MSSPLPAPSPSPQSPDSQGPEPGALPPGTWSKLIISFAVVFLLALLCGLAFKEPIEALGQAAVARFGLPGLSLAVFLIDSLPTPLSYAPFMLLAIEGDISPWLVFGLCSLTSISAGLAGYGWGRLIGMPPRVEAWIRKKYPDQFSMLERYGAWGVVLIGLLPLPFALGTWSAGATAVPLRHVALACLIRIPKTGFYILVITGGLGLGQA